MCGNFGLLLLLWDGNSNLKTNLGTLEIIESMARATEYRGGQAGGISCMTVRARKNLRHTICQSLGRTNPSVNESRVEHVRVRCVAQKRSPISAQLVRLFKSSWPYKISEHDSLSLSIVGHTRFATSSYNLTPELHPHEWVPAHSEHVWMFDQKKGKFVLEPRTVVLHLSHNGDFDAFQLFGKIVTNGTIGLWLERVLHCSNDLKGDSPKLAGLMDLFRVQGRWGASARLAYQLAIATSVENSSGSVTLSKSAPNTAPSPPNWAVWDSWFGSVWEQMIDSLVEVLEGGKHFCIPNCREKELCTVLEEKYHSGASVPDTDHWSEMMVSEFIRQTVHGFIHMDMYSALSEILGKAMGSFGIQVHCTLEPGVVVIGCKGQPMALSFSEHSNIVLFASDETAASVAVERIPETERQRLDLDELGEVARVGPAAPMVEASFSAVSSMLELPTNIHIQIFSLTARVEVLKEYILQRCVPIQYPSLNIRSRPMSLVESDLRDIPSCLWHIDNCWDSLASRQSIAAKSLCEYLLSNMRGRTKNSHTKIDLLIVGIETSLWVAHQFAADCNAMFPTLNVMATSANKVLGISGRSGDSDVFFPGSEPITVSRLSGINGSDCCFLLVSQSGQTFPTLHATRELLSLFPNRVWIMTGSPDSQMKKSLLLSCAAKGLKYQDDRVISTMVGRRIAEPSSVTVVAAHHSLTRLLLRLVDYTRDHTSKQHQGPSPCPSPSPSPNREEKGRDVDAIGCDSSEVILLQEQETVLEHLDHESLNGDENNLQEGVRSESAEAKTIDDAGNLLSVPEGSIRDMHRIVQTTLRPNMSRIVGYDAHGKSLNSILHRELVQQGLTWADHIMEPWIVLLMVAAYLLVSVTFHLSVFTTLLGILQVIITSVTSDSQAQQYAQAALAFSFFDLPTASALSGERCAWMIAGFVARFLDAILYIYCAKLFTRALRWYTGRSLWARMGRRTLVIVDTPMNHQLLESFVSKLFAESYGFIGIDVHGASGLDHFVHRFTHRVHRGLLLAVGRPDGRLTCLSKSEHAVLLSIKQATFVQNPQFPVGHGGPEIVSVGHNPFTPASLTTAIKKSIVLPSDTRRKFVDEYVFSVMATGMDESNKARATAQYALSRLSRMHGNFIREGSLVPISLQDRETLVDWYQELAADFVPYGICNVEPSLTELSSRHKSRHPNWTNAAHVNAAPDDILAFSHELDRAMRQMVVEGQVQVQRFYECRIASLERFVAFCVIFSSMAHACCSPPLLKGWDVARSQSNLAVATTAAPVSAHHQKPGHDSSKATNTIPEAPSPSALLPLFDPQVQV